MSSNIPRALIALAVIASAGAAWAQEAGRKVIAAPNAPNAIGPYSQAMQAGKTRYLAGFDSRGE